MGRRWVRQAAAMGRGLEDKAAPEAPRPTGQHAVPPARRHLTQHRWVQAALLWPLCVGSWAQSTPPAPVPVPDTQGLEISDRVKRDAERPMYWIRRLGEQTAGQDKTAPERSAAEKAASDKAAAERAARTVRNDKPEKPAPAPRTAAPEPAPGPALATRDSAVPAPLAHAAPASGPEVTPATTPALAHAEPGAPAPDAPLARASGAAAESVDPTGDHAAATDVAMNTPERHPEPAVLSPPPPQAAETLVLRPGESLALPDSLMRRMRRGSVEVKVQVAPDGSVMDATIVQSSHPRLDQPALEAIKAAHFQPVTRPTSAIIQFGFDLDS